MPVLNRRKWDRYAVVPITLPGVGDIVEISRGGFRVRTAGDPGEAPPMVSARLGQTEHAARAVWREGGQCGFSLDGEFEDTEFLPGRLRTVRDVRYVPQIRVDEKAVLGRAGDTVGNYLLRLLIELENPQAGLGKVKETIEDIRRLDEDAAAGAPETRGGQAAGALRSGSSLGDMILAAAQAMDASGKVQVREIDFALSRLGLDRVQGLVRTFVRKRLASLQVGGGAIHPRDAQVTLSTLLLKRFCQLFGLSAEISAEGGTIFSLDAIGIQILTEKSSGILEEYYRTLSRAYAEASRIYERTVFGTDALTVNGQYFRSAGGMLSGLFGGYLLAYQGLYPEYPPDRSFSIALTRPVLLFSYVAYLTFLSVLAILDHDRESWTVLLNRLKGRKLDERRVIALLDDVVKRADAIVKDVDKGGGVRMPSLQASPISFGGLLPDDPSSRHFTRSLEVMGNAERKRLAMRYEDDGYAHFILGRLINAEEFGLASLIPCVVPCGHVADEELYPDDFRHFELLVLKDVDRLPPSRFGAIEKLWNAFEGTIIATFSRYSTVDLRNRRLHGLLREEIVDFPSYFSEGPAYRSMVARTVASLQPYLGGKQVPEERYLQEVRTMNCIRAEILQNAEVV